MIRPRALTAGVVRALLVLALAVLVSALLVGCSDDDAADEPLVKPTTTTTTTAVGVGPAPTSTFLPNTDVVAGQEAVLTGIYSQLPDPSHAGEVCHFVTIDDGTKVSVAFTDTYLYDGVAYPGPADYPGDPEEYPTDPLLVHPDDRIVVRGEVVEVGDDACASQSAHTGLTVLVSTFAPS